MSIAGLVLAAGDGIRFGGPKALAATGDRTWLEIAIVTLLQGGCRPIVVVLGAEAEAARAGVRIDRLVAVPGSHPHHPEHDDSAILWVTNENWRSGRTGSLQCGLRALAPEIAGVIVHAVDHPEVRPETVTALRSACTPARAADVPGHFILLPVHGGQRGHPVLLSRAVWPEVLALFPDDSLRTTIRRDPARVREVEVDDPAIHRNRNEPEPVDPAPPAPPEKGDQ